MGNLHKRPEFILPQSDCMWNAEWLNYSYRRRTSLEPILGRFTYYQLRDQHGDTLRAGSEWHYLA